MADRKKTDLNEDQILAYLKDAVDRIRSEEDPVELNLYRRLFRKAVPFALRAYFAAYVLKQMDSGRMPGKFPSFSSRDQASRSGRNRNERTERNDRTERSERTERNDRGSKNDRGSRDEREERTARSPVARTRDDQKRGRQSEEIRDGRQQRESREPREVREQQQREPREPRTPEPRNILPDDIATTLFVSIGRNRRVYPRDLIGLILQNVQIEREHIGDIRVLDNYSFVQVITEDAEKVIAGLNEFEYRGRKLAVSFSRKRDDVPLNDSTEPTLHESVSGGLDSDDYAADDYSEETDSASERNSDDNGDIQ